jgi:hypothetical protein
LPGLRAQDAAQVLRGFAVQFSAPTIKFIYKESPSHGSILACLHSREKDFLND